MLFVQIIGIVKGQSVCATVAGLNELFVSCEKRIERDHIYDREVCARSMTWDLQHCKIYFSQRISIEDVLVVQTFLVADSQCGYKFTQVWVQLCHPG